MGRLAGRRPPLEPPATRRCDEARAGAPVLLGHTLDDQAETVLLGLGRGSGARSIAGHAAVSTRRGAGRCWACDARSPTRRATNSGSRAWQDPHNTDPRYTRARLRPDVLPLLEDVLGGGVAEALARTATALREDSEALDDLARTRNSTRWSPADGLDARR